VRRLFWLGVGAGVAGVATRRARKVKRALTPAGVAGRVAGLGEEIRDFREDVRAGMAERELELRLALGLDGDLGGGLDGGVPRADENLDDWKGDY
jgi:hypothetical protein